ncbi:Histone-lysine N-methyltransferase SETMAR [Dufourea novaeangliae]|uniref:Histone-lysine N-methyltransferase SETMAR n=1 Tax=Dufourea novaeangliae TaxID=178035 RepID=A0A154P4P8_DUFNO|nr:Histone-lysine N-methyltransferase SETMAR [Dufourea novaeangliae]
MENKQIRTILLYEYKLGRKAAETARNINQAFGQGTVTERTAQHWFQKFRNGDESLEDAEGRGRPSLIDNDELKAIIESDPRKTSREVAEVLNVDHSTVIRHLSGIGKCKKLDKWVPHELNESQRFHLCPILVNRKGPILLHDNARPHVSRITVQKLNELGYETLPHPSYSPDLSPTDYHLFKHLEMFLREKNFKTPAAAKNAVEEFIASKTPEFYNTGINKLVLRRQKCIESNGSYFD